MKKIEQKDFFRFSERLKKEFWVELFMKLTEKIRGRLDDDKLNFAFGFLFLNFNFYSKKYFSTISRILCRQTLFSSMDQQFE